MLHEYEPVPVAVNEIDVRLQVSSVLPVLLVIPAVGAVLSSVVLKLALAVHPLLPVAVTVKVPAVLTVMEAVVAPVLQLYVAPPLAVKVVDGVAQVNASPLLLLIDAVGAALSSVVVTLVLAVQPLLPVAVTVNVPAVLTVIDAVVAPVLQLYVAPPLAVKVVDGVVQLNASPLLLLMEANGAAMSCVMRMLSVSVHPFAAVTVTV